MKDVDGDVVGVFLTYLRLGVFFTAVTVFAAGRCPLDVVVAFIASVNRFLGTENDSLVGSLRVGESGWRPRAKHRRAL